MPTFYEARDPVLENAVKLATKKAFDAINNTPGRRTDFVVTHVVEWGYRHGGFTQEENFYVRVAEGELPLAKPLASSGFDNGNA